MINKIRKDCVIAFSMKTIIITSILAIFLTLTIIDRVLDIAADGLILPNENAQPVRGSNHGDSY